MTRNPNVYPQRYVSRRTSASRLLRIIGLTVILLTILACPTPTGGDPQPDPSNQDPSNQDPNNQDPDDQGPAFTGFSFPLEEGTYWEYAWSYSETSFAQGSGSSGSSETGRFKVTLGSAGTVDGITMYAVTVTGDSTDGEGTNYAPRWNWIGLHQNCLAGSVDGIAAETIFDAETGAWNGGGFFIELSKNEVNEVKSYNLENEFISTVTLAVTRSSSEGEGFYLGETFIPPSDEQHSTSLAECYKPGIGPVGYKYRFFYSNDSGGFYTSATTSREIGLIGTNLSADDGFVPKKPVWTKKTSMLHPRALFAAGVIDGLIYAAGGGSDTLEVYDPAADTWTELAAPPAPISSGTAYNGKLYCIGWFDSEDSIGWFDSEDLYGLCVYDPSNDTWIVPWGLLDMDFFNEKMVAAGGSLYILNGSGSPVNEVLRYTPAEDSWAQIEVSNAVYQLRPGAASDGTYLYAAGGYSGVFLNTVRRMRLTTGVWENCGAMGIGKTDTGAAYLDGRLYIAGGDTASGTTRVFECRVLSSGIWKTLAGMPTARENPSVVPLSGKLYVIGGSADGGARLSVMEEYDPSQEQ